MIALRRVEADDWAEWRVLRRAALGTDPAAYCSTLADWSGEGDTEARWRERLSIPGALDLLAELDGTAAGIATGIPSSVPKAAALISMWVAPAARGRGVGDALVRAIVDWSRARGFETLHLDVIAGNEPAIGLYRRQGFEHAGIAPGSSAERVELRMVRSLSGALG